MITITLKGREIPLMLTSLELKSLQEEIGSLDQISDLVSGRNPEDAEDLSRFGGPGHLDALSKAVKILGNAGLEENGQEADLTEKKVLRALKPKDILDTVQACIDAINAGWESEIPEEENKTSGPVDVGLQEMQKKEEPAD